MFEKIEKMQTLAVGILVCVTLFLIAGVLSSKMSQNVINVTGSAYKLVKSDSGSIEFAINVTAPNKQAAYAAINKQAEIVKKYLKNKNITDVEIKSANGYPNFSRDSRGYDTNVIISYTMNLPIDVKSNNVELIKEISTDITSLINQGIDISIYQTNYNYSKLADLKVELLEEASKDAKARASSMLKPTGNRVGKIQSVRMGVYQITPADSTNVSDVGINDTSSIDKKVTAVANVSFRIK